MNTPVENDDCHDLELVRNGDLEAFGRIHDRYARLILSICRRQASSLQRGSLAEAEDSTQEVFIRAYQRLDRIDDCTRLGAWLARIASFVVMEKRRATARRLRHEGSAMMEMPTHVPAGTAEAEAMRRERFAGLEAAMEELTDQERLAIHIHYLDTDPIDAARRSLGMSRSGYYKLLARAREHLADLMRSHQREHTS